jgi:hypothetical protein
MPPWDRAKRQRANHLQQRYYRRWCGERNKNDLSPIYAFNVCCKNNKIPRLFSSRTNRARQPNQGGGLMVAGASGPIVSGAVAGVRQRKPQ